MRYRKCESCEAALDSEEICDCHHEREPEEDNMFAILCDADKRKRLIERNGNTVGLSLTLQSAYKYTDNINLFAFARYAKKRNSGSFVQSFKRFASNNMNF